MYLSWYLFFPLFLGDQIFMQDSKLKCLQNKLRKEAFKLREKITIIQYGMSWWSAQDDKSLEVERLNNEGASGYWARPRLKLRHSGCWWELPRLPGGLQPGLSC